MNPGYATRLRRGVLGVASYEWIRSLTPIRVGLWIAMVLIPTSLIWVVAFSAPKRLLESSDYASLMSLLLFVLLPEIVTVLGMLLWATPIVNAEMEGQTWIYAVIRPEGRASMLLGKYIVAVLWTTSCGWMAATLSIPLVGFVNPLQVWMVTLALCLLSSIAHGALFALVGVLGQRRSMVIAFSYAVVVEGMLGWVPAVINQFTIAYRIRSLMASWLEIPIQDLMETTELVSRGVSTWVHIAWLLIGAVVLLGLASWRVQAAQYLGKAET
jgi:ABC-type transport system involved in multi-copper enzyme maturation permease subunit